RSRHNKSRIAQPFCPCLHGGSRTGASRLGEAVPRHACLCRPLAYCHGYNPQAGRRAPCRRWRDGEFMSRHLPSTPAGVLPSLQADAQHLISAQTAPRRTILVVEDDFFLRSAVVDVLCRHGFTVFAALDTNKAWDYLQSEAIDLLVTDIRLPGFV